MKPVVTGDKRGWVWMTKNIVKMLFLEAFDYQESDSKRKIHGSSPQYSTTSNTLQTELTMEELENVVAKGDKFEKAAKCKKSSTSWNFRTVKTLMQGTRIDNCPIKNLSTTKKFSMPTLIGEMKPVVLVKHEFEYREKINLGCFLWKIETIRTLMQETKTMVF